MTIALGKSKQERGLFDLMDNWLRRDRFVFVGWSGVLLLPCAYFALGAWLTGTTFVTSWYSYGYKNLFLNVPKIYVSKPWKEKKYIFTFDQLKDKLKAFHKQKTGSTVETTLAIDFIVFDVLSQIQPCRFKPWGRLFQCWLKDFQKPTHIILTNKELTQFLYLAYGYIEDWCWGELTGLKFYNALANNVDFHVDYTFGNLGSHAHLVSLDLSELKNEEI